MNDPDKVTPEAMYGLLIGGSETRNRLSPDALRAYEERATELGVPAVVATVQTRQAELEGAYYPPIHPPRFERLKRIIRRIL